MGKVSAGAFYIQKEGFTVVQHNSEDWEHLHRVIHDHATNENARTKDQGLVLRSHAYTVNLVGANSKAQILPDKPLESYSNYFIGNDPSHWASNCKTYQGITIKDVYPGIDMR